MDRLVEPHLVEVDVGDVAAQRILLVVLEDRRVRVAVAVEDDVEDGVQSAGAGEHATKSGSASRSHDDFVAIGGLPASRKRAPAKPARSRDSMRSLLKELVLAGEDR